MNEDLRNWFREKWVRMDTKGNIKGDCAREEGEGKPKCLPLAKASSMSKEKRAAAARRKRREDPVANRPGKGGKPVNVATEEASTSELIKKSHEKRGASGTLKAKIKGPITLEKVRQLKNRPNATTLDKKQANFYINMHTEEYLEEKNTPTNPSLWSKAKSLAKQKFDVYPSAYANGWAAKWYKSKGGGWKSVQEEKLMKSLKEITEGVVVMSDFKLDKKGRKYKAHRKTMSPTAMDIAKAMRKGPQVDMGEDVNPYEIHEEGDYPHVGTGTSRSMQMARDIATNRARSSMMKAKYGDDVSGKDIPAYDEDKLDLKSDDKGNYVATVKMREKIAAMKESLNPYNEAVNIQGHTINDDDWYVVHNKTKKIINSVGGKSHVGKQISGKAGYAGSSAKVDDEHTAYTGMKLKSVMKEEVDQVDEVSKKTLAGYISGAAKDIGYEANVTGFVAGKKTKGHNPTEETPRELKRHAGIAKALKRLVKESNGQKNMSSLKAALDKLSDKAVAANRAGDDAAVKAHQTKMNIIKDRMNKLRKEEVEQVDEISKATATSYVRKKMSEIGKRSGDATPKDFESLARAYKRMGVSDKAMKEEK